MAGTGNTPSDPSGLPLEILDVLPGPQCTEITVALGQQWLTVRLDTEKAAQQLGMAVPDWRQVMMHPPEDWPDDVKLLVCGVVQEAYRQIWR